MQVHGVGKAKAAQVAAVFELARRLETFVEEPKRKICSPKDVYALMYPKVHKYICICIRSRQLHITLLVLRGM